MIVTSVIGDNPSHEKWRVVFFIASAILIIAAIFYSIFAKATPQKNLTEK